MTLLFGAPTVSRAQAMRRLADLEEPGLRSRAAGAGPQLLWVPFDASGAAIARGLELPRRGPSPGRKSATPPTEGRRCEATATPATYWPFWHVDLGGRDHALIDAATGEIAALEAAADPVEAKWRFAFFVGLSLYIAWMASFLLSFVMLLVHLLFISLGATSHRPFIGVSLVLGGYLAFRVYRLLRRALEEPTARVGHGRVSVGASEGTQALLRGAGRLIFFIMLTYPTAFLFGPVTNADLALGLLNLIVGVLFLLTAGRLAKRERTTGGDIAAVPAQHPARIVADIAVWIAVIATPLIAVWQAFARLGILYTWADAVGMPVWPQANAFEPHIVSLAAICVLTFVPGIALQERWLLVIGLGSGHLAEVFFGDFGEGAVPLLTVAVAAFGAALRGRGPGADAREAARIAIATTWRFNVAATVGRLVGRLVGGVLLGTSGIILGGVLGETILAVIGVEAGESTPSQEELPPPSTQRRHQIALSAVVLAGTLVTAAMMDPRR